MKAYEVAYGLECLAGNETSCKKCPYYIEGIDISRCKKVVSRDAAMLIAEIADPKLFGFDQAIIKLKSGKKVKRRGWNGKDQYICLAKNISFKEADGNEVNPEHEVIGNKAIAFHGTSGVQIGWLASQADMLAEDWMEVIEW